MQNRRVESEEQQSAIEHFLPLGSELGESLPIQNDTMKRKYRNPSMGPSFGFVVF